MNPKTFFAESEATALVKWVDEDGNIVKNTGPNSNAGASSVERVSGSALQTLQVNKPNPAKFGGQ